MRTPNLGDLVKPPSALGALAEWYWYHCDGDWEHDRRIRIGTLDNPGWSVWINLADTELNGVVVQRVVRERSDHDWLHYWSDGSAFEAACGPTNLEEALLAFVTFAGGSSTRRPRGDS